MTRKLTITVSDEVYEGLHRKVGRRRISGLIDGLLRPHVVDAPERFAGSLADAYREIAADEDREREAAEWCDSHLDECLPDEDFGDWPGHPKG